MKQSSKWKWARVPALLAVTLSLSAAVWAGPLQDADRAYRGGNYVAAAQYARQAISENDQNPSAYVALGASLKKSGDLAGAKQAWDRVLALDPNLRSVKDDASFLKAYRSIGGDPDAARQAGQSSRGAVRGDATANDILNALRTGSVYVHPDLAGEVDAAKIEAATRAVSPTVVKVVVVAKLGQYPSRAAFADDLRKQLNLGENGAVLVATPKGISGVSERLSSAQVDTAFESADVRTALAQGGLNAAVPVAVKTFNGAVTADRRTDSQRSGGLLVGALALAGGGLAFYGMKKGAAMDRAKSPVETVRQDVLRNLSYVDGYLDLLPAGADTDRAKTLRAQAYEKYTRATQTMQSARRPEDVREAFPVLESALADLNECRADIDRATGGTGVAMAIPEIPDLSSDKTRAENFRRVEELRSQVEADRLQREVEAIPQSERGVSFFSGQPLPKSELVPVQIVIDGQKRSVMATRQEAAQIMRGETPNVRAFDDGRGNYVPWYESRGYDPYRSYYGGYGSGGGLGTFVNLMTLSYLFNGGGIFGGYGGWGGYGYGHGYGGWGGGYEGVVPAGGNDGGFFGGNGSQYDATPDHSGGFDFFGQGGYNEQSNDGGFGFGDSGGDSGGGFDFGGGDFGGGDFGGGDFGGGDW